MKATLRSYLAFLLLATLMHAQEKPPAITDGAQPALSSTQAPANAAPPSNQKCAKEEIYHVGRGVSVPRVIYSPPPQYPEPARRAKEKGSVVLSFVVASDGRTCNIKIDKKLAPYLDRKAVEAVSSWRFEPATRDGKPVAVYLGTVVDFKLF